LNRRSFVSCPHHLADLLGERHWRELLVLNWILSKQPETESAHASVKYHTLDLPSYHHRGKCSSHWNLWCIQMQQNLRCHSLIIRL